MDRQQSATVNDADVMRGASGGYGQAVSLVVILVCLLVGAAQAQWLDTTIELGVGAPRAPWCMTPWTAESFVRTT